MDKVSRCSGPVANTIPAVITASASVLARKSHNPDRFRLCLTILLHWENLTAMSSLIPWTVGPGYRVYPQKLNICAEVLDRHIREGRGGAQAVVWPQGRWTFAELQRVVNAFAAKAKACGLGGGDRCGASDAQLSPGGRRDRLHH
jgi:hypothetical protein